PVDADPATLAQRVRHSLQPGQVVSLPLTRVAHLDLGGTRSGFADDPGGSLRVDHGNGDVDLDHVPPRSGQLSGRRLQCGPEPAAGHFGWVLRERRELAPAGGPAEQHDVTSIDAPKTVPHREADHPDVERAQGVDHSPWTSLRYPISLCT